MTCGAVVMSGIYKERSTYYVILSGEMMKREGDKNIVYCRVENPDWPRSTLAVTWFFVWRKDVWAVKYFQDLKRSIYDINTFRDKYIYKTSTAWSVCMEIYISIWRRFLYHSPFKDIQVVNINLGKILPTPKSQIYTRFSRWFCNFIYNLLTWTPQNYIECSFGFVLLASETLLHRVPFFRVYGASCFLWC